LHWRWPGPAAAVNPDEVLDDPALEERARALSLNLRCLVCQNQSIDDSNAELARDSAGCWCASVWWRVTAMTTVIDYVVSRYGEFVLLKPRFLRADAVAVGRANAGLSCWRGIVVMFLYARGREQRWLRPNARWRALSARMNKPNSQKCWKTVIVKADM
jgi:cytochrome c-type biogenesis protein CcmH